MTVSTESVPTEHEIKVIPGTRLQVKLLTALGVEAPDTLIRTLKGAFGFGDFVVALETVRPILDEYWDTDDLALYKNHTVLRVRREGAEAKVVVKKLARQDQGEIARTEYEVPVDQETLRTLIGDGFAAVVRAQLPELAGSRLVYKLRLSNNRHDFLLTRGQEQYRLSLDEFSYFKPRSRRGTKQHFEIEVEALNHAASQKLGDVKRGMRDFLHGQFGYATDSKYERGIKALGLDRGTFEQKLRELPESPWGFWIGLAVGLIGLVLTLVFGLLEWPFQ